MKMLVLAFGVWCRVCLFVLTFLSKFLWLKLMVFSKAKVKDLFLKPEIETYFISKLNKCLSLVEIFLGIFVSVF